MRSPCARTRRNVPSARRQQPHPPRSRTRRPSLPTQTQAWRPQPRRPPCSRSRSRGRCPAATGRACSAACTTASTWRRWARSGQCQRLSTGHHLQRGAAIPERGDGLSGRAARAASRPRAPGVCCLSPAAARIRPDRAWAWRRRSACAPSGGPTAHLSSQRTRDVVTKQGARDGGRRRRHAR